jgi:sulfate transport system permease protein
MSSLGLGVGVVWLSLIVLLPIAAIVLTSFQDGVGAFLNSVTSSEAMATLRLTVGAALLVTADPRSAG